MGAIAPFNRQNQTELQVGQHLFRRRIVGPVADGQTATPDDSGSSGNPSTPSPAASPGYSPGVPSLGSADSPVVELRGAISLIDRFPALAGVDLAVSEGEIVLLRGPNGAGKSTLLRLCAGLAPLNEGQGTVLGFDLARRRQRRELRRQTGLLAHSTFLYDELTVEENLIFWAKANHIDLSAVEPVLDRLALSNRLRDVRVASLSAGQRRRASLAVLVCRRPRLWLLDEPHAGLDANGRDFVDGLIKHAIAFGATVIVASHDFDRAGDIATRTLVIAGGQIQDDFHAVDRPARTSGPAGTHTSRRPAPQPGQPRPGDGPRWRSGAEDAVEIPIVGSN